MTDIYATHSLLRVLCDLAEDADPRPVTVALASTPASDLDSADGPGLPLSDLDPDSEVLSDFYFPDVGDAVNRVFGVDLNTPPGQTTARFLSHPKGDPTISLTDDLHARVLVAVPPWTPDDVRAYDRRGRRLSLVVVAAETEEASVLD